MNYIKLITGFIMVTVPLWVMAAGELTSETLKQNLEETGNNWLYMFLYAMMGFGIVLLFVAFPKVFKSGEGIRPGERRNGVLTLILGVVLAAGIPMYIATMLSKDVTGIDNNRAQTTFEEQWGNGN